MKTRIALSLAAILLATTTLGAQAQTPAQIVEQIGNLLAQLKQALTVTTVTDGAGLTKALAAGGAIRLAPGTYTGNFVVTTSATVTGTNARLVSANPLMPTLQVSANDVVVDGLDIGPSAPDRETLVVGDPVATLADVQPHRVTLKNLTLTATAGGHRGIALHGVDLTVDHCTVLGYYEKGRDSQGIWINNGPGPYTITNNTVEASGENILLGGSDPGIPGVVPADVLIQGNTFRKPDSFKTLGTVKNSIELKTGVRVRILDNRVEGWWHDGQDAPVQFTVRNSNGACTWCQVDDVTLSGTLFVNVGAGFAVNILGKNDNAYASQQTHTITLAHNRFSGSTKGVQVIGGVDRLLTIDHNTFPDITEKFLSLDKGSLPKVMTPLVFTRNVLKTGLYGVMGDGSTGPGTASLTAYAVVQDFTGNVIEMTKPIPLPAGNTLVAAGGLAALLDPVTFKLLAGGAGY
jgi:hypothetical protein